MGDAVRSCRDNSDLVDYLVRAKYIVSQQVEDAFRAVDRGDYFCEASRDSAYKECALRQGPLHLSAPTIYATVAEALDLRPGVRFLNMGSGTGYLSTVIGLLLGSNGVNHGVELNAEAVAYAHTKLQEFKRVSRAFGKFGFCEPVMLVGNCLQLTKCSFYDRVYCGAACPDEHVDYVKNLLKVGGIAVVPVNDKLLKIKRTGEAAWDSKSILSVSFATLVTPAKGNSATTFPIHFKEYRDAAGSRDLVRKFTEARPKLVQGLENNSIECIIDELIAARAGLGLISDEERQLIKAEQTSQGKARRLLDAVSLRGADAIRIVADALFSSACARPDLAELFCNQPAIL